MWISDRSKARALLTLALVAIAVLRCGPPDTCVRVSDCAAGLTCFEGACVTDPGAAGASGSEGGLPETSTTAVDAATAVDSAPSDPGASAAPEPTVDRRYPRTTPVDDPDADAPPPEPDTSGF